MPVHCQQRVLWADVPFYSLSESKKVTQGHEIVRKIGKRADFQNEVSAIFTMRLESLCERGTLILHIEIMGAFLGVSCFMQCVLSDFLDSGDRLELTPATA